MTNQKLYLMPTTPPYENEKKIFYARQIEKYYQQMYHCHIDTNVY